VLIGVPQFLAGNYFYLRAPAPIQYVSLKEQSDLAADPAWRDGRFNYVVAPRDGVVPALRADLRCVAEYGKWAVYARNLGGAYLRADGAIGATKRPTHLK
jgi:hypothetical protein